MTDKDKKLSIGIVWQSGAHWHAGALYRENLIKVLTPFAQRGEIELAVVYEDRETLPADLDPVVKAINASGFSLLPGLSRQSAEEERRKSVDRARRPIPWAVQKIKKVMAGVLGREAVSNLPPMVKEEDSLVGISREKKVDFLYPLPRMTSDEALGAHWIPDLQHCFLPDLFPEEERAQRSRQFEALSHGRAIVFSSESSRKDFLKFWPEAKADLRVWHFCSVMEKTAMKIDPAEVMSRYGLPTEYFVVPNQFWKHKDHFCVLEALELLGQRGIRPTVVCTGAIDDYRNRDHINRFLQSIQKMGLHDQIRLLGFMDRAEQVALLRGAGAVIQPSRFEGWSTVVEDCRAIGQRLVLSDLDVHEEQAPEHSEFFETGSPESLAAAVEKVLPSVGGWSASREERETQAREGMEERRHATGAEFIRIARELHKSFIAVT